MNAFLNTNQNIKSLSLVASSISGDSLEASSLSGTINATTATISNLQVSSADIQTLDAGNSTFSNLINTNVTSGALNLGTGQVSSTSYPEGYKAFTKRITGISNNTLTTLFSISINQNGNFNNAGGYTCRIKASVGHDTATKYFEAYFSRGSRNITSGHALSTVTQSSGSSSATNPGLKDIGTVIVSVSETSFLEIAVQITVQLTGSSIGTADVILSAELLFCTYGAASSLTLI